MVALVLATTSTIDYDRLRQEVLRFGLAADCLFLQLPALTRHKTPMSISSGLLFSNDAA